LINYACLPLKNAMLSGMNDQGSDTYGYCSANNSAFQGQYLNSCITCLQASSDQVYMSNCVLPTHPFMPRTSQLTGGTVVIALESGCLQKPQPGAILGLVGSLFSKSAVNITGGPPQPTASTGPTASSGTMTLGTIVGIAVGAALLFLGGTALFFVYWRRQKKYEKDVKKDDSPGSGHSSLTADGQGPYIPLTSHKKSESFRSMSQHGSYHSDMPDGAFANNSDYYDKIEDEYRSRQYNFDPHKAGHGPNSAIPTHPAYIPRAMSRQSRNPSPNPSKLSQLSQPPRTNTPDSYTLRAYLNAPEDSVAHGTQLTPPPPSQPPTASYASSAGQPTPPSQPSPQTRPAQPSPLANIPPPPPRQPKVPALVLPIVPKVKGPRKYSPPKIVVESATPIEDNEERRMRITAPITLHEKRFQDRPLAGGVVYSTEEVVFNHDYDRDIAIGSGKSTLYG
jgi:hypothetical protein